MVNATAFRVRLGEDDPIPGDAVDRADVLVIAADDFHMLADLAEQAALLCPAFAPAGEIVLEPRLVFAAIVVVVAVELVEMAPAKLMIMRIRVRRSLRGA